MNGSNSQQSDAPVAKTASGLATTGLVLGILAILSSCIGCLSLPCAITGAILSGIALHKINQGKAGGKSLAIAGLVTSGAAFLLAIILMVVFTVAKENITAWLKAEWEKNEQQQQQQQQQQPKPTDDGQH